MAKTSENFFNNTEIDLNSSILSNNSKIEENKSNEIKIAEINSDDEQKKPREEREKIKKEKERMKIVEENKKLNEPNINEGGEFMSSKIFNKNIVCSLNTYEVLFLVNKENWDLDYKYFSDKFKIINRSSTYDNFEKVLKSLEDLLGDLKINKEIVFHTQNNEDLKVQKIRMNNDNSDDTCSIGLGMCFKSFLLTDPVYFAKYCLNDD